MTPWEKLPASSPAMGAWTLRKVGRLWTGLLSTYWFIPIGIVALGFGLAYGMVLLDVFLPAKYILHLSWVYTRDPAGARALLAVVSESMITVAGVVFSVTAVALTMASNQFGTRVLRTFIRDKTDQSSLGILLATFLYCLLVMRRVESYKEVFVPSLAVAVGVFLAILSIVVIIVFIHHVMVSMESESVLAAIATDLHATIRDLFPEQIGKGEPSPVLQRAVLPDGFDRECCAVTSKREGAIRNIDSDALLQITSEHDLVVEVVLRPGEFAYSGAVLARAWPGARMQASLEKRIAKTFSIGSQRTYRQDVGFAFQQLVLVTVRSLSPSVYALGTALDSIDRLGAALVLLANRKIPSTLRYDEANHLRVIAPPWAPGKLVDDAIDPIRRAAQSNPTVLKHFIDVLAGILPRLANPEVRNAVLRHLPLLADAAKGTLQEVDRNAVEQTLQRILDSSDPGKLPPQEAA